MIETSAEAIRAQLARIASSRAFAGKPELASFCKVLVERTLRGEPGAAAEEAEPLRAALRAYYRREGARDPVLIDLPPGDAPVFHRRAGEPPKPVGRRLWFLGICLFGYVLVLGGWWAASRAGQRPGTSGAAPLIAVLPFLGPDSDVFTAGMIDALRKQTSLAVLPYESVRGADPADPVATGRRLKASAVLAGEVNQPGGGTRIRARLFETKGGAVLWSQTYERNEQQAATTPGQIVHDLVAALRARAAADPNGRPGF